MIHQLATGAAVQWAAVFGAGRDGGTRLALAVAALLGAIVWGVIAVLA